MPESLEVTFENINEYLAGNTSNNSCEHTDLNISLDGFVMVGTLWDRFCGAATWNRLTLEGSDNMILGSFPYQTCDVYECKSCKQPILVRDDGVSGHRPFKEYYLLSSKDKFLLDPVFNVFNIGSDLVERIGSKFGIFELSCLAKIPASNEYERVEKLTIASIDEIRAVNVYRYQWKEMDDVRFELIAPRMLMRQIKKYIDELKQSE